VSPNAFFLTTVYCQFVCVIVIFVFVYLVVVSWVVRSSLVGKEG